MLCILQWEFMKRYSEILRDLEEMLGRKLTNDEIDHCYITQITGGWGFAPLLAETGYRTWRQAKRLEGINGSYSECVDRISHKPTSKGDRRYIAKAGNPVSWQLISEAEANRCVGILLVPERKDPGGRICCAQFVGRKILRVWMDPESAHRVVLGNIRGMSLLNAVETVMGKSEMIQRIMNN